MKIQKELNEHLKIETNRMTKWDQQIFLTDPADEIQIDLFLVSWDRSSINFTPSRIDVDTLDSAWMPFYPFLKWVIHLQAVALFGALLP